MDNQLKIEFEKKRIENIKAFHLIAGFIRHSLSDQQHNQLDEWINESDFNQRLFEILADSSYAEALQDIANSKDPRIG